jgi:lipoprotein-anchoring transpeptidase ErfK/SrfK
VLLHPSTGGPQTGWVRAFLIDIPIFLTASVSVAVFYICAQRELNPRTWMREMLLLPCLLALGVGLSINNARAVLEAVFNHKSDFARTPKYGIERKSQSWRSCRYMPLKSMLPLAELAFAVYFSYFVWFSLAHGQFLSVPFLLMFQGGFLYVALCSLTSWMPRFSFGQFPRDKRAKLSIQSRMFRPLATFAVFVLTVAACSAAKTLVPGSPNEATSTIPTLPLPSARVIISIKDQKLLLLQNDSKVAVYPISTSKYGLGDFWGRMTTPLGYMQVAQKIGDNAPIGGVFHNRRFTGEVLPPNAPGRDPITTRIIWLRGLEPQNAHAFNRCIYIHGTNEERYVGKPASFGCIRMKAKDVAALYGQLPLGALVQIVNDRLPGKVKATEAEAFSPASNAAPVLKGGARVVPSGGRGA